MGLQTGQAGSTHTVWRTVRRLGGLGRRAKVCEFSMCKRWTPVTAVRHGRCVQKDVTRNFAPLSFRIRCGDNIVQKHRERMQPAMPG